MQQFELTHEFLSQLEELIDAGNKTEVSKQIAGLHPADIAEILEELNNERAQFVFLLLDNEKAGDVLAEIDEEERVHFIESFPAETIARRFIDNMDSDDAADLLARRPTNSNTKCCRIWRTSNRQEILSIYCIMTRIRPEG